MQIVFYELDIDFSFPMIFKNITRFCYRSTTDFPKVLGLAMDTFMWCCDDENSDVRLMADECLNRTIKVAFKYLFNLKIIYSFKFDKTFG